MVLVPLGDDFRYNNEVEFDQQYENYMKLMHFINQGWKNLSTSLSFFLHVYCMVVCRYTFILNAHKARDIKKL